MTTISRCFLTGLLLATVGCGDLLKESVPEPISFINGRFSFLKPAGWSKVEGLNEAADLQMGNHAKEAYIVALTEPKLDFDNISVEEHSQLTRDVMRGNLEKFTEDDGETMTINGMPAIRYVLHGTVSRVKVKYWHVTVASSEHFTQILIWSRPSKFPNNEEEFNTPLMSFEENGSTRSKTPE